MRGEIFYLLLFGTAWANSSKICLTMIVKNERFILSKCLESVKPWIDYWVIVDTGSTDGTQEMIREIMKEIPGELHEKPWIDFATNRNQAFALARGKGDYCLKIDADEVLVAPEGFSFPPLKSDLYLIPVYSIDKNRSTTRYNHVFLMKNSPSLKWEGPLHEMVVGDASVSTDLLENIHLKTEPNLSHRSKDPEKHLKDAKILEAALQLDPGNIRNQFFLAVSYELSGQYEKALNEYEKCANMTHTSLFYRFTSLFQIGVVQELLGKEPTLYLSSYEKAHQLDPRRAEPLYRIGFYYAYKMDNFKKGYDYFKKAAELPLPISDVCFLDESIYHWKALYQAYLCLNKVLKEEAEQMGKIAEKLKRIPNIPPIIFKEILLDKS